MKKVYYIMGNERKQVAWNASEGIIMEISNRRTYANTFFVNGDIKKAINTLIAIKQSVIQSLTKEERESLNVVEQRFNQFVKYLNSSSANSFNSGLRKSYNFAKEKAAEIYSEYNDTLMDLLETYGYLISEKTDASKMRF